MIKRPDDQTRWQRLLRRPSAGQRGWDYAHAWLATQPDAAEWRQTLNAHAACHSFDPSEHSRQFVLVIDFYLRHGYPPEAAPIAPRMVTPTTQFVEQDYDCVLCARPGSTCVSTELCPHVPA